MILNNLFIGITAGFVIGILILVSKIYDKIENFCKEFKPIIRANNLEIWLRENNVKKLGDKVFFKYHCRITSIIKGEYGEYFVEITPLDMTKDIGSGAGCQIRIDF